MLTNNDFLKIIYYTHTHTHTHTHTQLSTYLQAH